MDKDKDKELILLQCEKCGVSFERFAIEKKFANPQSEKDKSHTFYKYRTTLCDKCFHEKMKEMDIMEFLSFIGQMKGVEVQGE